MCSADKWLLCSPRFFDVRYEINPWMKKTRVPDRSAAQAQWDFLVKTLSALPVAVSFVEQGAAWPDMVFTANAGLVYGRKVVLSAYRHAERKGEEPLFEKWFIDNGFEVLKLHDCSFEGEGDALFAGTRLFCGYGFRSDEKAYEQISALLGIQEVVLCHLVNPSFYHLDTCFCPLNSKEALCVLEAFDAESIKRMEEKLTLLPVNSADAACFACNALVLGQDIILPAGCVELPQLLEGKGYRVHQVPMGEFMKAGGAAKCLSLKLSNP